MARLPKDAAEAVASLDVRENATVIAIGPDHGFIGALSEAIGAKGKLIVQSPPPDDQTDGAEVVDGLGDETKADTIIVWISVVPVHTARELGTNVSDGGSLWLVLPKANR